MPLFKPWNLIHAPDIIEVRELLSCWRSRGGAESFRGQGRDRNADQALPLTSCFCGMEQLHLQEGSVCVCKGVQGCECTSVCTFMSVQPLPPASHLDFSSENSAALP